MRNSTNHFICIKCNRITYRAGLTHGVNGKKYILILFYLKAAKKRSDMTYLNWKERKTDSAAKPSKANDLKIFLINFFSFYFLALM